MPISQNHRSLSGLRVPFCERFKVEQALAVRVLDRLVAAADEDAFESGKVDASGDDDNHGANSTNSGQPGGQNGDAFGGGRNHSLAGRVETNRRRSSSANSLSVSEITRQTGLCLSHEGVPSHQTRGAYLTR